MTQKQLTAWARALLAHADALSLMPLTEQEYLYAKRMCEHGFPAEYVAARIALTRKNTQVAV